MIFTLFWVLGGALSISFLCSILEAVLLSINHSYVAVLEEGGHRAGRYLKAMQARIDEPIAAILTLNTIAHTVGATMGGAIAQQAFGDRWITLFSVALTLAILLFSEIVPKTIGAMFWQELARPTAYTLRAMIVVMKPILVPLSLFSRLISARGKHQVTVSRAELEVLAEIGRREGTLDEGEWQVVTNVMRLDEVVVGEVMTPRTDVIAVSIDATVEEAKDLMLDEGHLRLPVYEESLDHIAGILLARDLWRADREDVTSISEVLRPVHFAPSTKPVEELIHEMRTRRDKMVIVLDEFGGTAGLVTLEDLLEEIVGEIQDEHEADEPIDFQELWGGRIRVHGGVPLREALDRLGLQIAEDSQHDTLGGYLFGRLDRVGRDGVSVYVDGGIFRIVRMDGRRIAYALFTPRKR